MAGCATVRKDVVALKVESLRAPLLSLNAETKPQSKHTMSDTPETDAVRIDRIDVTMRDGGHLYVDGGMVSVEHARKLERERNIMRNALQRISDCDWVITLPDRMDGVRKIARDALEAAK